MAKGKRPVKTEFTPKNPDKYKGKYPIICRSSWERTANEFFDNHPYVTMWSSESIEIKYRHPLTGRWTVYIPDYLVVYHDGKGRSFGEIVEIKPLKESVFEDESGNWRAAITPKGRGAREVVATQVVNMAKWQAAKAYCRKMGLKFTVLTERELFAWSRK